LLKSVGRFTWTKTKDPWNFSVNQGSYELDLCDQWIGLRSPWNERSEHSYEPRSYEDSYEAQ